MPAAWEFENNNPKLLVGMPHRGDVTMEWALMFRNIQINVQSLFTTSKGTPWDMARNEIVKSAKDHKVEWLFFLDTDVIIPPDTIPRLMSHNLPIVSGVYWTRAQPLEPCVWREVAPSGKQAIPFTQGEMIEADFVGAGCLLVHMSVFDHIKQPYFEWTLGFEDPNDLTKGRSEDFEWCKKVRDRGYKIMVDTGIQCRHMIDNGYADSTGLHISPI